MVTLTDSSVSKFKEIVAEQGQVDHGVRLYLTPGGWSPSLAMGIVQEAMAGDTTLEQDGLKMFLERDANNLLDQATIDFSETQGFIVTGMPHSSCSHH